MNPQPLAAKRAVSVDGETIIKRQEPGASRRERLRTEAGREVGQRSGLFVVPEIVSFDDSRGEIVFERLRLTGIRQVLSDPRRSMDLAGRAAEALAAIHGRMEPSDSAGNSSPPLSRQRTERQPVPLHGDFAMSNLFCIPDSDEIVVIDWANADWMGMDGELGAPEIDVAVFLISYFHRRLLAPQPVPRRHGVARHFLTTYAAASPEGLDLNTLRAVVAAAKPRFKQRTRRRKGTLRALGYIHAMIDLELFIRRLAQHDFAGQPERQRG